VPRAGDAIQVICVFSIVAGAAYVFARVPGGADGEWSQSAKLTASDGYYYDRFGYSLSASGDVIAVGAPYKQSPYTGYYSGELSDCTDKYINI
jgi:hypothetical protein